MNYEFHVGDYVETAGGAKGYICDTNKDWWRCTNADDEYSVGYVYRIVRLGSGGGYMNVTIVLVHMISLRKKRRKLRIEQNRN